MEMTKKEKHNIASKKWIKNNPEKAKINAYKWRKNNPNRYNIIAMRSYHKHRDKKLFEMVNYRTTQRGKYARYKGSAKEKGLCFKISFEEFIKFWNKPCYYCGDIIETVGLDRIDSEIGYRIDNVVSCCSECNYMKLRKTPAYFINKCKKITDNYKNNGS